MPRLTDVCVTFHQGEQKKAVLEHLSLDFPRGKITALMGASGCGKTTVLRLLGGIISPNSGNVTRETSDIAFMFQDACLLPWLSAAENVNLVLSDTKQTMDRALSYLAKVGLEKEADAYPAELSGGMQQRVALVRALASDGELLLLDEPFRGLDEALHERMLDLIKQEQNGRTVILVTHDKADLRIADVCYTIDGTAD